MSFYEETVETTKEYINEKTGFNIRNQDIAEKIIEDIRDRIKCQSKVGNYSASIYYSRPDSINVNDNILRDINKRKNGEKIPIRDSQVFYFLKKNNENIDIVINMIKNNIGEQFNVCYEYYNSITYECFQIIVDWEQKTIKQEKTEPPSSEPDIELLSVKYASILVNKIKENIFGK